VHKVGKILENVLAGQPRPAPLMLAGVRLALPAVLGPELAARCLELDVADDTLWITTADGVLAQELRRDWPQLLRRLDGELHLGGRLRRLRVRVA
jgi:Dna[CI] antecedent, DciA